MPLVNVTADFSKVALTLERIANDLAHGIRILETAFPLANAATRWGTPSDTMHIATDETLLETEREAERATGSVPETEEETVPPGYNPYDL